VPPTLTDRPARRAGRPPKIAGPVSRWWIYVSAAARTRAEERAAAEGVELPDVLRAMLDAYAYGQIDTDPEQDAVELLPWAPTDDDGLAYRQALIGEALAQAYARGIAEGVTRR
jgi:hypothetical protein